MKIHFILKLFCAFGLILSSLSVLNAQNGIIEYRGKVIDGKTKKALESASLIVDVSNISTITNSEGEFLLKVPSAIKEFKIVVSLLGYTTQTVSKNSLTENNNLIQLKEAVTALSEVNIAAYKDASNLVKLVFDKRMRKERQNELYMTGFYRESVKRRNRNVSLTEAVINILKQPNSTNQPDIVKLGKARKSTDYKRLDTVSVKLQGGPFSTLYLDIMKYPEFIFTTETFNSYIFSFDAPTSINNRQVFVVNFKPRTSGLNLNYYGKLYIDAEAISLVSAEYALDVSNKAKTKNLLVKKKPKSIVVYPLEATYKVDYQRKDDLWFYSYASLYLRFKVNKKRQLFNKVYALSSELAITDWELNTHNKKINPKERLKPSVIISDAISGFSDVDFWGKYNVIEPDKSIETAIEKIQKNIKKQDD
ncbi:carboxypeptidase-like regulatory domain-containing protein [uncultured Winogradskyella sp.]|uniref:carboxypeptidase-like regulatory domain-containing protein n=1 Tax=uncultured Winogradskyella sp. TaxID=395353 RepID=UPI002637D95A|nr:carboxypeptidase-like regulatory domain-containing protein [uncultured Winogradskyella sp.]